MPASSPSPTPSSSSPWRPRTLFLCVYVCMCTPSCLTLCDPMDRSLDRLLCPRNFPGKNTGVGCRFLLQGIFPTQGSNPGSIVDRCFTI